MDWDFHIGLISLTVTIWHSLQTGTDRTVQSVSLSGEHCGRLNDVSQSDEHCGRLNDVSQSVR